MRRTELVLVEKGINYELVNLSRSDGDLKSEAHLSRNARGRVPVLEEGTITLYESQAIVEYLEERFPLPALVPTDIVARAHMRIEEMECVLYFTEALVKIGRNIFMTPKDKRDPEKVANALTSATVEVKKFDARAAARGGPFVMGEKLSRADFTWLPFIELVGRAGINIDDAAYEWSKTWRAQIQSRPSYDKTFPAHWR